MVSPASRAVGKASFTPLTLLRPPPARKKPPLLDVTPVGTKINVGWRWLWGGHLLTVVTPPGVRCWAAVVAFGSVLFLRPVKGSEGSSMLWECYSGPPKSL